MPAPPADLAQTTAPVASSLATKMSFGFPFVSTMPPHVMFVASI